MAAIWSLALAGIALLVWHGLSLSVCLILI